MTEPASCPTCGGSGCGLRTDGLTDVAALLSTRGFAALWDGRPVRPEELIPDRTEAAQDAMTALASAGRCEVDDDGRLVGIHGLTLRHARHALAHGDRRHHTWCALDAVGIPAALALDATIATDCPHCLRRLDVAVVAGVPVPRGPLALWLPETPTSNLMEEFCSAANLYCSVEHLEMSIGAQASGRVVDLDEAAAIGRHTWADLAGVDLGANTLIIPAGDSRAVAAVAAVHTGDTARLSLGAEIRQRRRRCSRGDLHPAG